MQESENNELHVDDATEEAGVRVKGEAGESGESGDNSRVGEGPDACAQDEAREEANACAQDAPGERGLDAPKQHYSRVAVFCVGNKLYLDDGAGPAVYEELLNRYEIPFAVSISDVGCMSMDMIQAVDDFDLIITVDAVDGTGSVPGTVFRYTPEDMARNVQARTSLHDLRLADLFDAAAMLGYSCDGVCIGIQVQNRNPVEFVVGLTPPVYNAMPMLIDTLAAELARAGHPLVDKFTGLSVDCPERSFSQTVEWKPALEE